MTGINATKTIRNLEFVNSLHRIIVRERAVLEQTDKKKKAKRGKNFSVGFFYFLVTGSGTRSRPPLGAEAAGRSESLPAFNTALFLANGTRVLRIGSRSVPQYGPESETGSRIAGAIGSPVVVIY